jgi:hypothetical protein
VCSWNVELGSGKLLLGFVSSVILTVKLVLDLMRMSAFHVMMEGNLTLSILNV